MTGGSSILHTVVSCRILPRSGKTRPASGGIHGAPIGAAVFDAGIIVMVANPLPPYIPIRRELYRQGCGVLSVWAGGVQVEA